MALTHLRIYNQRRSLLFDLPNVTWTNVTPPGALVIDLDPDLAPAGSAEAEVTRLVLAPGYWATCQEVRRLPEPEPAPEVEADEVRPMSDFLSVAQGGFVPSVTPIVPGFAGDDEDLSDAERVHRAMQIVCQCKALRCPIILNPASDLERKRARRRMFGKRNGESFMAEPLKQCSQRAGHDPMVVAHAWRHGEWMYGIAGHHPECPRHPDRYNRPKGEGQPYSAGLTPTAELPAPTRSAPTEEMARVAVLADQLLADPETVEEIFGRHAREPELGRPYVTGALPVIQPVNQAARTTWKSCAVYYPQDSTKQIWCDQPYNHSQPNEAGPGTAHSAFQGGDRIHW